MHPPIQLFLCGGMEKTILMSIFSFTLSKPNYYTAKYK
jgi:hypothetical protein